MRTVGKTFEAKRRSNRGKAPKEDPKQEAAKGQDAPKEDPKQEADDGAA